MQAGREAEAASINHPSGHPHPSQETCRGWFMEDRAGKRTGCSVGGLGSAVAWQCGGAEHAHAWERRARRVGTQRSVGRVRRGSLVDAAEARAAPNPAEEA